MAVFNGDLAPDSSDKVDWWDGSYPTGASARTCSVWIKAPKVPDNGDTNGAYFWTFGQNDTDAGANGVRFSLRVQHAGELDPGAFRNEVFGSFIYGTTNVCDDIWHHVCVTWDGTSSFPGNATLYVDGSVESSTTTGSSITVDTLGSLDHVTAGGYNADPAGAFGPIGWIADVAEYGMWSREFSAEEVAALAEGISPIAFPTDLMFHVGYIREKTESLGTTLLTDGNNTVSDHPRIWYP